VIVEIGTCDFETAAGHADGLFIEPLPFYFNRLPATCRKENVAVSNYTGQGQVYFLTEETIAQHGLPDWLRGCNCLNQMHPTVAQMVASGSVQPEWVQTQPVPVVRIKSLLDKHNITHIKLLKIDTEGHDAVILNDFLDTVDILPQHISFENNGLVPAEDVATVVLRLEQRKYKTVVVPGQCDAFLLPGVRA
jgi:FkbM family methyltransferase